MKHNKTIIFTLFTSIFLCFSSLSLADSATGTYMTGTYSPPPPPTKGTYGEKIGNKALWGLSNATLGWFELPKNVIRVTNKSNLLYGLTGGVGLGVLNTVGRTVIGVNDLLFFLLPTHPVVTPIYPWNDYLSVDTSYHDIFAVDF